MTSVPSEQIEVTIERTFVRELNQRDPNPRARRRDGGLVILGRGEEGFDIAAIEGESLFRGVPHYLATIPQTQHEIAIAVDRCRDAWNSALGFFVVDNGRRDYPFRTSWDFQQRPEYLQQVGPELAVAGDRLFHEIFKNGDQRLRWIATQLEQGATERDLLMTVSSDNLFVPWSLLYTHPAPDGLREDGRNWLPQGFWGARHIVEHRSHDAGPSPWRIGPQIGGLRVGLNVDRRLDVGAENAIVQPVDDFFVARAANVSRRYFMKDLRSALIEPGFDDQIMYFCGHGYSQRLVRNVSAGEPELALSDEDGTRVRVSDIRYWLKNRSLVSSPLVFLNLCGGGQVNPPVAWNFAAEFMRRKAMCVVGVQSDIPSEFASHYAIRLFERIVDQRESIGDATRSLASELLGKHANPLGLLYTLYLGADAFVEA